MPEPRAGDIWQEKCPLTLPTQHVARAWQSRQRNILIYDYGYWISEQKCPCIGDNYTSIVENTETFTDLVHFAGNEGQPRARVARHSTRTFYSQRSPRDLHYFLSISARLCLPFPVRKFPVDKLDVLKSLYTENELLKELDIKVRKVSSNVLFSAWTKERSTSDKKGRQARVDTKNTFSSDLRKYFLFGVKSRQQNVLLP